MPRPVDLTPGSTVTSETAARISVVAGILLDRAGRVLLAERPNDRQFAGLWEFPGGKVDDGETPGAALRRELREELGVEIAAFESFLVVEHDYPDRPVRIEFFRVTEWQNRARGMLNQKLKWLPVAEIRASELLPANAAVAERLRRDGVHQVQQILS